MCSIVYGGLDVHLESIQAHLICEETGEVIIEAVLNDRGRFVRAVRRWSKLGELRLCYEASGGGFVVKRWLDEIGVSCEVIAPSLIPRAPGDKVKTDKRDAKKLAIMYKAGALHTVAVPGETEETVRALVRLRGQLTRDMTRSKNRIVKYLRTLGMHWSGKGETWTQKHRAWISGLALDERQRAIVECHLEALDSATSRRESLDRRIEEIANTEPYRGKVQRLLSLRGMGVYSAMVLITEMVDPNRFCKATGVMSYFGLVPRESSSGDSRHTGAITKVGNAHGRWILTEAAWNQTGKPGTCKRVIKHWKTQPDNVVELAKKAEKRLHDKFWGIALRKDRKTAAAAVAREMAGFVWALLMLDAA